MWFTRTDFHVRCPKSSKWNWYRLFPGWKRPKWFDQVIELYIWYNSIKLSKNVSGSYRLWCCIRFRGSTWALPVAGDETGGRSFPGWPDQRNNWVRRGRLPGSYGWSECSSQMPGQTTVENRSHRWIHGSPGGWSNDAGNNGALSNVHKSSWVPVEFATRQRGFAVDWEGISAGFGFRG